MYKVTVAIDGMTATASKLCRTKREAERIKNNLLDILKLPIDINIVRVKP